MLYVVQRPDGKCFRSADYIDPTYAEALSEAASAGVEIYPVVVDIRPDGIYYSGTLPVAL
jgi:sugar fermentation stimulation protein A